MSARKLAMIGFRLLLMAFFGLVIADVWLDLGYPHWWNFLLLVLAYALVVTANRPARASKGQSAEEGEPLDRERRAAEPIEVDPPVTGRWSALNSPANRTPSHGTHAYGQTYAIDIVAEPEPGARPGFRALWPLARRNADFPAFRAPLHAVADGTVVRAEDRQRDHLSRTSLPGLLYLMLVEASVREMAGVRRIVGNHLVLDLGDGTHALYAHLNHGSLTVAEGDRVRAGQVLARCGNSGNSSEPHVHFQLMDGSDPDTARGLPFRWRGIGVPGNGEIFEAPVSAEQSA
ncbi:M23 family metallopeptidase [Streptomyces cinnabarinus]|uniref:M23 family metallopeptidase n=1 Tax=Streptomyces cinnabarinus TaxID=67287 RepID=A0ABY7KDQ3_9ACTN|nr:M23 family metallopeptidase [Streptomyces cinnabarinus]WAZ22681.1 M23 family metallopeptidase [Streptomyces cinnabarinus]